ncbi:class I SAM-dependent methyltransferase [Salisediminibacterium beveridgei]|uniref:SAM-dependent methyltransferase, MidA family n=1 Tax=Salisediminibacterium beveridgei TaxID=632773 RepID=A0A1D7QUF4_9BACI|nr:SAM-dependent methyltransferase [Salisediminibacterium beveridgei]AOM82641.1 hypothetical protein BBEV_1276 [Salisediminibacterium beveridgei]
MSTVLTYFLEETMKQFLNALERKAGHQGPWTFYEFMNTALYDEEMGYYTNERTKLGKEGDFYTSNHVHPVFSHAHGRFFADIFDASDLNRRIIEIGSGDGRFALEVLTYLEKHHEDLFNDISYCVIEASAVHRDIIKEKLTKYDEHVEIFASLKDYQENHRMNGIIYSNELFDAMPVHVVEKSKEGWNEVLIQFNGEEFNEISSPCQNPALLEWLSSFGPELEPGFRTELNPDMKGWLEKALENTDKAVLMTVDYGYRNDELNHPQRRDGSLRGYRAHELIHNPLETPGRMDITSHIQWDAYDAITKAYGCSTVEHLRQDQFLLKAGIFRFLQEPKEMDPFSDTFKLNRAIQSLVTPDGISGAFQVDIKSKGTDFHRELGIFTEDPYRMT